MDQKVSSGEKKRSRYKFAFQKPYLIEIDSNQGKLWAHVGIFLTWSPKDRLFAPYVGEERAEAVLLEF